MCGLHVVSPSHAQILVILGMLVRLLTWLPALAGLLVTLAVIPLTTVLSQRWEVWRERLLVRTDARVKLVTEAVTGGSPGVCSAHRQQSREEFEKQRLPRTLPCC
jgi:hypothetical protein